MALARFFIDEPLCSQLEPGDEAAFALTPEDARHAAKALRIKSGEQIELVVRDSWNAYRTQVISLAGTDLVVRIEEILKVTENLSPVTLMFGLSKGDKNDTIVRQAVEIGADKIVPVIFERSVVRLDSEKAHAKGERLRAKARSAAMQAHRSRTPEVLDPMALKACSDFLAEDALIFVLWEEERDPHLIDALKREMHSYAQPRPITLIVGPEGGIAYTEIDRLKESGAIPVSLGDSILRVDTANAVALGVTLSVIKAHQK